MTKTDTILNHVDWNLMVFDHIIRPSDGWATELQLHEDVESHETLLTRAENIARFLCEDQLIGGTHLAENVMSCIRDVLDYADIARMMVHRACDVE